MDVIARCYRGHIRTDGVTVRSPTERSRRPSLRHGADLRTAERVFVWPISSDLTKRGCISEYRPGDKRFEIQSIFDAVGPAGNHPFDVPMSTDDCRMLAALMIGFGVLGVFGLLCAGPVGLVLASRRDRVLRGGCGAGRKAARSSDAAAFAGVPATRSHGDARGRIGRADREDRELSLWRR